MKQFLVVQWCYLFHPYLSVPAYLTWTMKGLILWPFCNDVFVDMIAPVSFFYCTLFCLGVLLNDFQQRNPYLVCISGFLAWCHSMSPLFPATVPQRFITFLFFSLMQLVSWLSALMLCSPSLLLLKLIFLLVFLQVHSVGLSKSLFPLD